MWKGCELNATAASFTHHQFCRPMAMDFVRNVERPSSSGSDGGLAFLLRLQVPCYIRILWMLKYLRRRHGPRRCGSRPLRISVTPLAACSGQQARIHVNKALGLAA